MFKKAVPLDSDLKNESQSYNLILTEDDLKEA
jgi:hypothetical protein